MTEEKQETNSEFQEGELTAGDAANVVGGLSQSDVVVPLKTSTGIKTTTTKFAGISDGGLDN
jgi:hypothetical protein